MLKYFSTQYYSLLAFLLMICLHSEAQIVSSWVHRDKDNHLVYYQDSLGNRIPDFSAVGYRFGKKTFPEGIVIATLSPNGTDDTYSLQKLIDSVSKLPITELPKVIELKKGNYTVTSTLFIKSSELIIRGEGSNENGTVINFIAKKQSDLFHIEGHGKININKNQGSEITDLYVPVGATQFHVKNVSSFSINQKVVVNRVTNDNWIHVIQMDNIQDLRDGGKNWTPNGFELSYERIITDIDKQSGLITINAPIVMALDTKYGVNSLLPYCFDGRINEVGMENLRLNSSYSTDTDEQHGWVAIKVTAAENCWLQNVVSVHFGLSCVNLASSAKNCTVRNCSCLDPISTITGGRRYSFNCDGQLNLFQNCTARNGRHDFVTGARVCGPNVFSYCNATHTHADIGPHHRWATGTLYDNIVSDGAINAQDRGNYGTGHGWSGAYQVFWNCSSITAAIQNPPMAYNWNIGYKGTNEGAKLVRTNGIWEATNVGGVKPKSLYDAQVAERK